MMNTLRNVALCAACLFSGAVWAQSAAPALNLKLPAQGAIPPPPMPASSTTAARPAHATTTTPANVPATAVSTASAPGVYYGDTSGRTRADYARVAAAPHCDDSTYNQPQTHGSVSMGVMGGNHVSGNYQAGTVNITRNFGSCEHPTGSVGISISVGQSRFGGRPW